VRGFFVIFVLLKTLKMNNLIIKRSQLIEAQFTGTPAAGKKYQFTEIPNISRNNIIVYGFEAFTATQLATTPNNNTVVAASTSDQLVVTVAILHRYSFIERRFCIDGETFHFELDSFLRSDYQHHRHQCQ
jgi:hypothetical protein